MQPHHYQLARQAALGEDRPTRCIAPDRRSTAGRSIEAKLDVNVIGSDSHDSAS